MKLVFIYGPPATGKLTTAKELAKLSGYKILPNHEIVRTVASIFPYSDERLRPSRKKLSRELRRQIIEEAAKMDVDLITTFGQSGQEYFDFFRDVKATVNKAGGQVVFVHLFADEEVLLSRVESESRQSVKIDSADRLKELITNNPEIFDSFPDEEHLKIDNTHLSASQVAERIQDSLKG